MSPAGPAEPLLLEYAPARGRRRRFLRWVMRAILAMAVMLSAWLWGPLAWRQIEMLYWQRMCRTIELPDDTLAFDSAQAAIRLPVQRYWAQYVRATAEVGPALSGLPLHGSLVFVGELKTPSGEPRIVAIALTSQRNWWLNGYLDPGINYQHWVLTPGTLIRPPQSIDQAIKTLSPADALPPVGSTRFFFGQRDSSDPSRFTLRYEVDGTRYTIDASLDDQGQLTLKQRNPPASIPIESPAALTP